MSAKTTFRIANNATVPLLALNVHSLTILLRQSTLKNHIQILPMLVNPVLSPALLVRAKPTVFPVPVTFN